MTDFEENKLSLLRTLIALARKVRTLFDARTGAYGLTEARAGLLLHLSQAGSLTQSELADAMEVERPTMARLIDGMETSGMVRRDIDPKDRRQRHVQLTESAEGQVAAVLMLTEQLRADVLAGISEEDLAVTHNVLRQMLENVATASQS